MAAGVAEPVVAAAQATRIVEFAERVLKTPYAITPMRASRCRPHVDGEEDEEEEAVASAMKSGLAMELLQRLKDSVGCLRGELGVCPPMLGTSPCTGAWAHWASASCAFTKTSQPWVMGSCWRPNKSSLHRRKHARPSQRRQ